MTSKLVSILMAFGDHQVHSLTEIARLTSMLSSTTHRLVGQLVAAGGLARDDESHSLLPDRSRLLGLNGGAPVPTSIAKCARRPLEDLSSALHTRVRLGLLQDYHVAYIDKTPGRQTVTLLSPAATLPAHASALGKALLAFAAPPASSTR